MKRMSTGELFRTAKANNITIALCASDGETQLGIMYYDNSGNCRNSNDPVKADVKAWSDGHGGLNVVGLTPKGIQFLA